MPGPEAGPAQGRGVIELHQGEAGEGVLSLDLSALGQRQEETWRKRGQMKGDQQPVTETRAGTERGKRPTP